MGMAVIHISEADAARDFPSILARACAGEEVVIEANAVPIAILRGASDPHPRRFSEFIALAEARAKERGYEPVMDSDFAADLEEIIRNRKPGDHSAWE
jgi:antitoxin (DNA-binding transcriptional repressor) of toxin-antitoxin stability system